MIATRFRRVVAAAAFALVLGCGGSSSNQLGPAAVPIALKMREALNKMNTSDLATSIDKARELYSARAITKKDLERLVLIYETGNSNSWEDAKKLLNESMPTE
jgi:hypothetical protein